jgi:dTDP-4-amino-4,6-dideoxygalactose transaminase
MLLFDDLSHMIDASLDMWLTSGRFNNMFERKLADFLGVRHALSVNSGSSANLLAISALTSPKLGERALKRGDEVITTAVCFPTTVAPIIQNGLTPVFVDCEIDTGNVDVSKMEEAISEKTKAVFIGHTLGNPFDLRGVLEICKKHDLWLIEDSCDALGAYYNNDPVGTIGHIGTFSFYPAHHITTGEGGAVVTNDPTIYQILASLRGWGRDCWCPTGVSDTCQKRFSTKLGKLPYGYDHKYIYSHLGYNMKITDWQAAIGVSQLNKMPHFIKRRRENVAFLRNGLRDLEEYLTLPPEIDEEMPYSQPESSLEFPDSESPLEKSHHFLDRAMRLCSIPNRNKSTCNRADNNAADESDAVSPHEEDQSSRKSQNISPSWLGFLIIVKENDRFSRQDLLEHLEKNGIGTRHLFAGNILRHPAIMENNLNLRIGASEIINSRELDENHYGMLPNSESLMRSAFWVGCSPNLRHEELKKISLAIRQFIDAISDGNTG